MQDARVGISGTAMAESTVSAVQAALRRHQTHIHELQVSFCNVIMFICMFNNVFVPGQTAKQS